ncbi:MAG: hypothetical protein AAFY48_13235 [Bacteroidota bacterium]
MNKNKKAHSTHPLDETARKGMALFDSEEAAQKTKRSLEQRLSAAYPTSSRRRPLRYYLTFAASLLVIVSVFAVLFVNQGSSEPQWVLANNWTISPQEPLAVAALAPKRSEVEQIEEQLIVGREAYAQGKFQKAANAFYDYLEHAAQPRPETYLFLGHAQLQYAPEQAILTLKSFAERSDLDEYYRDLAKWYKAWAQIRSGQRTEAEQSLKELTAQPSPVQADAKRLLDLLTDPGSELTQ